MINFYQSKRKSWKIGLGNCIAKAEIFQSLKFTWHSKNVSMSNKMSRESHFLKRKIMLFTQYSADIENNVAVKKILNL